MFCIRQLKICIPVFLSLAFLPSAKSERVSSIPNTGSCITDEIRSSIRGFGGLTTGETCSSVTPGGETVDNKRP